LLTGIGLLNSLLLVLFGYTANPLASNATLYLWTFESILYNSLAETPCLNFLKA
jgi:hypothetical protein